MRLLIMEQELTGLCNAPVVFAHNDLLSGNIMLNDDEGIFRKSVIFVLHAHFCTIA